MITKLTDTVLISPIKLFERLLRTKQLAPGSKRDLIIFVVAWILSINTVVITVLLFSWVIGLR
jgi:ABC-type arginine transport system permease subunit